MVNEKSNPQGTNTGTKETTSNNDDGVSPQTLGLLEEAKEARKGIKEDLEKMELLAKELKELRVNELLGGQTRGAVQEQKPKVLSDREFKDAFMKGQVKISI